MMIIQDVLSLTVSKMKSNSNKRGTSRISTRAIQTQNSLDVSYKDRPPGSLITGEEKHFAAFIHHIWKAEHMTFIGSEQFKKTNSPNLPTQNKKLSRY